MIEGNCIIAAGAVLTKGPHVIAGSIWAGVPVKKVKDIDQKLLEGEVHRIANNCLMYVGWFR